MDVLVAKDCGEKLQVVGMQPIEKPVSDSGLSLLKASKNAL